MNKDHYYHVYRKYADDLQEGFFNSVWSNHYNKCSGIGLQEIHKSIDETSMICYSIVVFNNINAPSVLFSDIKRRSKAEEIVQYIKDTEILFV